MSEVKWIRLISTEDEIRASLIASALHQQDIPAVTINKKDTAYAFLGSVYVLVPESQLHQSRKVLVDEKIVEEDAFDDE